MTYHITITGDDEIYQLILKNTTFEAVKEKSIMLAKTMKSPKTLMIFDAQTIDKKKLYEYVKR